MEAFPDDLRLVIVDDLFVNYDLGFAEDERIVYVYCATCDDIVTRFTYEEATGLESEHLYQYILNSHRPIE